MTPQTKQLDPQDVSNFAFGTLPSSAPTIPSGEEIYNTIMGAINPSLTLPELKKRKQGMPLSEAEQRKITGDFEEYNRRFTKFSGDLQNQVHNYQHFVLSLSETFDRSRESGNLQNISSDIASSN